MVKIKDTYRNYDIAILIGRKGSKGFPGKNTKKIGKKNLCEYPVIAAKKVKSIKRIFVATDCKKIKQILKKYKVEFIDRPKKLNTDTALGEDVYKYCYEIAKRRMQTNGEKIRYIVLLMANAPMINSDIINQGIKRLNKNKKADSAVTVSKYNMWSPIRARKINNSGFLDPFIPFNKMGLKTINCDRDSQGNVYYADMSASIVKPKCIEQIEDGLLPQKWMGHKILPIFSNYALDLDYAWQLPQVEYWIKKNFK